MKESTIRNLIGVFEKMDEDLLEKYFYFSIKNDDGLYEVIMEMGIGPKTPSEATSLLETATEMNNLALAKVAAENGAEVTGWADCAARKHHNKEMLELLNATVDKRREEKEAVYTKW